MQFEEMEFISEEGFWTAQYVIPQSQMFMG